MAARTKIKIRRSNNTGVVPTINDLADGELALNIYDGKLFFKKTVSGTSSIVTLQPTTQLTAGTGVSISNNAINIGQAIGTTDTPTFAGATLNGITSIVESGTGAQNTLTVAGAGTGSVFAVRVSDTAGDGINLKSLTSDLANPAKLTLSGSSVVLTAGSKQLTFNSTGNLVLPSGGDLVNSSNVSILKFPTLQRILFDTPILDQNVFDPTYNPSGGVWYTSASETKSSNNSITVGDSGGFSVNSPVVFFGSLDNIQQYKTYYIKTIPDSNTITISETKGGTTLVLGDSTGSMNVCGMSTSSYQTQRAPRIWTNYESLETTGWDYSSITFGDTWYDDSGPSVYVYINQGDGIPTPVPIG
jgi:hypothetical protein